MKSRTHLFDLDYEEMAKVQDVDVMTTVSIQLDVG